MTLTIHSNAIDTISLKIAALPPACEVPNVANRLEKQANPNNSFDQLWFQFIVCGFSSQEKSDPGTPLERFAQSESPLLRLSSILEYGDNPSWIKNELNKSEIKRMQQNKIKLVLSARTAFASSIGKDNLLKNGNPQTPGLGIFIQLAQGQLQDHSLKDSKEFSQGIDATAFHGIGHKQIRNILVNSGLAHNVLPLDSRWKGFLEGSISFTSTDLAQKSKYLKIEDILRQALQAVSTQRDDLPNLAVLDALVFAAQSKQGHRINGWAGSTK